MIYIILLLLSIILFLIIYYKINQKKIEQQIEKDYLQKNTEKLENQLKLEKKLIEDKLLLQIASYKSEISQLSYEKQKEKEKLEEVIKSGEQVVVQLEKRKEEQTKLLNEILADRKGFVEKEVEAFRTTEMQKARIAVETEVEANQKWAMTNLSAYWNELAQSTYETEQELQRTKNELADYKKKQDAINEAIRRQRKLDEQQDFYRVCLSDFTIEDINLLQGIRQKLHTSESLNKLIYDVYVSKAVQEMVKRVLQGGAPSGIYKITRLKTGETYIGKSTNVKDRWQQHCKTVFGAGTIAHSILHTTMQKDGLQNFTFELIEEVPKDKLTEREKYWINFYGSKEYGLNERNG